MVAHKLLAEGLTRGQKFTEYPPLLTTAEREALPVTSAHRLTAWDSDLNLPLHWNGAGWFMLTGEKLILYGCDTDPASGDWTASFGESNANLRPMGFNVALSPNSLDYLDNDTLINGTGATLDLGGLTSLVEAQVHDNPGIAKLNVQGCSALETLVAYGCSLSEIDVHGLVNLETLHIQPQAGDIESVNARGCTSLTDFDNADYFCVGPVDFSGCTSILFITPNGGGALSSLNCDGCSSVENISTYGCPNLRTITAKNCTSCTNFDCYEDDVLETLDVSGCDAIEFFDCDTCPELTTIVGLGDLEALQAAYMDQCDALIEISFNGPAKNDFTYLQWHTGLSLVRVDLRSCSKLETIYGNDCPSLTTVVLPTSLDEASDFEFDGCALTQKSVDDLIFAMPEGFTGTLYLDGGTNSIPSAAAIIRAEALNDGGATITYNS